jgi:hypothetical protein
MRCYRLSVYLPLALAASLAYSTSQALAARCWLGMNIHNHTWIVLHHRRLAQCNSGSGWCKCLACYNFDGSVSANCYSLAAPIPH